MSKKTLALLLATTMTLSFSVSGEALAATGENSTEISSDELEVKFLDSFEDAEVELEVKQAEELEDYNGLEKRAIPEISLLEANMIGEVCSSRAEGVNPMSSDQSVTVSLTGTISSENEIGYVPVTLAPGDILQVTLEVPNNASLDYDLHLFTIENQEIGEHVKSSTLSTYINTYPDNTSKSVDEGIAYINNDSSAHTYAVVVMSAKGYSATESYKLTVSVDEKGYYDASEPNESPFDVKLVTSGTKVVGNNLNVSNDQDWYVIESTEVGKMGFRVSESSYDVDVYLAVDTSMQLMLPDSNGVYTLGEAHYYIKVYNKNSDFVSKDYTLEIEEYGTVVARMRVGFDSDMGFNGKDYRFYQILLPAAQVFDKDGRPVVSAPVTLWWRSGGRKTENGGYETKEQTILTDPSGFVQFRMVLPRAFGTHHDVDEVTVSCGSCVEGFSVYHMREY